MDKKVNEAEFRDFMVGKTITSVIMERGDTLILEVNEGGETFWKVRIYNCDYDDYLLAYEIF